MPSLQHREIRAVDGGQRCGKCVAVLWACAFDGISRMHGTTREAFKCGAAAVYRSGQRRFEESLLGSPGRVSRAGNEASIYTRGAQPALPRNRNRDKAVSDFWHARGPRRRVAAQ